ncbi:MAG: hypothetical protein ACRD2Z_00160 [Thermoanaerobaculia bacterium]
MPEGVIAGGWSFVAAAYSITVVVLTLYVWSLVKRGRAASAVAGEREGGQADDD